MTQEWSAGEGLSRTYTPTWDILIASIEHRTGLLTQLLEELGKQLLPGVGVRVLRDNLQATLSEKCQRLLDSSQADYVSFVDDDDWVAEDYVPAIYEALRDEPDYVGFNVLYTVNGAPQMPALHSLQYNGWHTAAHALLRDISHLNPIKRTLAVQSPWIGRDNHACDYQWAGGLRELGCVRSEVYIERDLYHYRYRPDFSFGYASQQAPLETPVPRPDFPWVTWID